MASSAWVSKRPFFQSLVEQGVVAQNVFSFTLGDGDEGELYLGGSDSSKYSGEIVTSPVIDQGFWMVQGGALVDGKQISQNANMIIECVITAGCSSEYLTDAFATAAPAPPWSL